MTIIVDASELRSGSSLPEIPNAQESLVLEELTGADLMVTGFGAPATNRELIQKHIENGAVLVQRKQGLDLVSSMGTRLNTSLAKMHSLGALSHQCVLLFIGVMTCDYNGQALIDSRDTMQQYWSVQSAISKWHDRGGVYENISRASLIPEWCRMKMRHLNEYASAPTKTVMPDKPVVRELNAFQVLEPVNDGRVLLATLPGIGVKTASILWDEFGNLAEVLCWLTMTYGERKIKGIGEKTIENVREYLGLDALMELSLTLMPEEYWPSIEQEEVVASGSTLYEQVVAYIDRNGAKSPAEMAKDLTVRGCECTPKEVARMMLEWKRRELDGS